MQYLDLRTVLLSTLLVSLLKFILMFSLWRQARASQQGMGLWALATAASGLETVLLGLRGAVPDWLSIILANQLMLLSTMLVGAGLARFFGKPIAWNWLGLQRG